MGVQRIEVKSAQISTGADGTPCMTLLSGTGAFEIYFTAETWALLGRTAKWFEQNVSQDDRVATLSKERDDALAAQRDLGSQLRAMTENRNELAMTLEQYENQEDDEPTTVQEEG